MLVYHDAGSLTNGTLYGPELEQFFADEDALGEVLWGLSDHQGTVRDLVEYDSATNTTNVVNHLKYDSFGNVTSQSNAAETVLLRFTGRYWDEDIQAQWHNARWYEPRSGLWLSPDPIGFAGGDANLYRYVGNSPVNGVDPFGLDDIQVNVRQGWSPAAIAYYNSYIAYYENQQTGDPPADPYGASLWNDVTLMVSNPGASMRGALQGVGDGSAMVINALTLQQISRLDAYVDRTIAENGGAYYAGNVFANGGALATYLAAALAVLPAAAAAAQAEWAAMGQLGMGFGRGSGFVLGETMMIQQSAAITINMQQIAIATTAITGLNLTAYMVGQGPPDWARDQLERFRSEMDALESRIKMHERIADVSARKQEWHMYNVAKQKAEKLQAVLQSVREKYRQYIDEMLRGMGM